MKTGIGQSKYCIPQPFSRCLISLCSSLFDFNSMKMEFCSQKIEMLLFVITHMPAVMSRANRRIRLRNSSKQTEIYA